MPRGRPRKVVSETLEKDKNLLDDMIAEEDDSSVEEGPKRPSMSSPNWNDYVLSLLTDNEFDERVIGVKLPKTDGLARVARLLFDKILESDPEPIKVDRDFVVMKHRIVVIDGEDTLSYAGIGDATPDNTDPPYDKFLSPVASTRARGRAYRDLLGLKNVPVAEELSDRAESDVMITSAQKAAMKNLSLQLNIDLMKFVNMDGDTYPSLDAINKNTAARMLEKLNGYKAKREDIRVDILKGE